MIISDGDYKCQLRIISTNDETWGVANDKGN